MKKEEKKNRPKEERNSTILSRKEKKYLKSERLVLAELHAGVHISNKEVTVESNFAIRNV